MIWRSYILTLPKDYCPLLSNPVGLYTSRGAYFNRKDVKQAIHAPLDVEWQICSYKNVFAGRDRSLDPIQAVLPQVIEGLYLTPILQPCMALKLMN